MIRRTNNTSGTLVPAEADASVGKDTLLSIENDIAIDIEGCKQHG